jgi:hypothetical protein
VRGRRGGAPSASASTTPADPVFHQIRAGAVIAFKWWVASHRAVLKELSGPSRPYAAGEAVQRIALCAAVDLVVALLGLFVVAMAVAPILGL